MNIHTLTMHFIHMSFIPCSYMVAFNLFITVLNYSVYFVSSKLNYNNVTGKGISNTILCQPPVKRFKLRFLVSDPTSGRFRFEIHAGDTFIHLDLSVVHPQMNRQ